MKREIKFRGKRLDTGEWMNDMYTLIQDADGAWLQDANECQQIDPDTLGQFTGLLDRSRKEVYEGDKIIYGNHSGTIIYLDSYATFALKEDRGGIVSYIYPLFCNDIKIINNPELLKGAKV